MIWNHPAVFLTLLLFPPFFFFAARAAKGRRRKIETTFAEDMRVRLFGSSSRSISFVKYAFLILALFAFLCVFAGPRFGKEEETRKVFGRDVFILFDVSDSMLAEDVSPNRLTVARLDVEDLLEAAVGDRIGLVAFAGSAQVEIPLTTDYDFFRELLRKVDTKTVRLGGTATGDAIRLALKRFGQEPERKRLIFLITDGEDHDSFPLEAAKNAAEMGVPIVAIGIGSPDGAKIPVFNVSGDRVGYKTFDGREALSKTDVETLKEIAKISNGRCFYADSKLNFADVYKTSVEIQDRDEISEESRVVLKDRYQPFLAFGLCSFMLFYFCPERVSLRKSGNLATFILLTTSLTFALANETYASPQDENVDKVGATSKRKGKSQEIKTYNRSLKIAEKDFGEFVALQTELADAKTPEVSSRANYNLAAIELQKARENAKTLKSVQHLNSKEENASQAGDSENAQLQEDGESQTKDPVEEYVAARRERDRRRREIADLAETSSLRFFNARDNRKLGRESLQNAEIASNWRSDFDDHERVDEKKLRENALANPEDHLRWLEGELGDLIGSVQDANPQKLSTDFYRSLGKKNTEIKELNDDVNSIAARLRSRLINPSDETTISTNPTALPSPQTSTLLDPDPEGAEIISQALNRFETQTLEASKKLDRYDADAARKELRRAETQLTTFRDVPKRYDELVVERSRDESSRCEELEESRLKASDIDQFDDYRWSRDALGLSVDEIMRKARRIVEARPEETNESSQNASSSRYAEWEGSDDDEPIFDPNDSSELPPAVGQTKEDPALKSARIALEREQELRESVKRISDLVQSDLTQEQDKEQLLQSQKRIAEILDEIARPFQEENQQNQNSKNQDKNRQNQDSNQRNQDQDQNDQSQNQDDENADPQKQESGADSKEDEKIPDELEQPESSEKNEPKEQDEGKDQKKETTVEIEEPEQEKKRDGEKKKTEEQKQADELMRRVFRRQKDAEPQREAVRQALKKREKSGKDW